jgi:hypothetical protein
VAKENRSAIDHRILAKILVRLFRPVAGRDDDEVDALVQGNAAGGQIEIEQHSCLDVVIQPCEGEVCAAYYRARVLAAAHRYSLGWKITIRERYRQCKSG